MKRNCTVLVLILAILLCVGCSNPSDKVEENIPSVDTDVPSENDKPAKDLLASPAIVLEYLTKSADYSTSNSTTINSLTRTLPKTENGESGVTFIPSLSNQLAITPNVSTMFLIVMSNDIAPLIKDRPFDNDDSKGFTPPVFETVDKYSKETYEYFLSTFDKMGDAEEMTKNVLEGLSFKDIKIKKNEAGDEVTISYLLKSSNTGEDLYTLMKCRQSSYFEVLDVALLTFGVNTSEESYAFMASNTVQGPDKSESNNVQMNTTLTFDADAKADAYTIDKTPAVKQKIEKTSNNSKTVYSVSEFGTGATCITSDDNGFGHIHYGGNEYNEIYDSNRNLLLLVDTTKPNEYLVPIHLCIADKVTSKIDLNNMAYTGEYAVLTDLTLDSLSSVFQNNANVGIILNNKDKMISLMNSFNEITLKENLDYVNIDPAEVFDLYKSMNL